MSGINTPTIFIKKASDNKYYWVLCLSENSKKPSCKSPSDYTQLIKCRQGAMRFAQHISSKIRIIGCDEIAVVDEVGDQRK